MATITLHTIINAPIETCFLLSLSVDLHTASVSETKERAISGVTKGLMRLNDTVTWEAKHLGFIFHMTTKIPVYEKPTKFVSEMVNGPFKKIYHQHLFTENSGKTIMTDIFELEAPFGIFGKLAERVFLLNYMKRFLIIRNEFIKTTAETDQWKRYL